MKSRLRKKETEDAGDCDGTQLDEQEEAGDHGVEADVQNGGQGCNHDEDRSYNVCINIWPSNLNVLACSETDCAGYENRQSKENDEHKKSGQLSHHPGDNRIVTACDWIHRAKFGPAEAHADPDHSRGDHGPKGATPLVL